MNFQRLLFCLIAGFFSGNLQAVDMQDPLHMLDNVVYVLKKMKIDFDDVPHVPTKEFQEKLLGAKDGRESAFDAFIILLNTIPAFIFNDPKYKKELKKVTILTQQVGENIIKNVINLYEKGILKQNLAAYYVEQMTQNNFGDFSPQIFDKQYLIKLKKLVDAQDEPLRDTEFPKETNLQVKPLIETSEQSLLALGKALASI